MVPALDIPGRLRQLALPVSRRRLRARPLTTHNGMEPRGVGPSGIDVRSWPGPRSGERQCLAEVPRNAPDEACS